MTESEEATVQFSIARILLNSRFGGDNDSRESNITGARYIVISLSHRKLSYYLYIFASELVVFIISSFL